MSPSKAPSYTVWPLLSSLLYLLHIHVCLDHKFLKTKNEFLSINKNYLLPQIFLEHLYSVLPFNILFVNMSRTYMYTRSYVCEISYHHPFLKRNGWTHVIHHDLTPACSVKGYGHFHFHWEGIECQWYTLLFDTSERLAWERHRCPTTLPISGMATGLMAALICLPQLALWVSITHTLSYYHTQIYTATGPIIGL